MDFDPDDTTSWNFGSISRDEAISILTDQPEGTFLVRDSSSLKGDSVLTLREGQGIKNYIINRIKTNNGIQHRIGDLEFGTIPDLLAFYKRHYLDTSNLVCPAPRVKLRAKYDFAGKDPEDLSFKKDDILELIYKTEPEWWTVKDTDGKTGLIPANHVTKYDPNDRRYSMQGPENQSISGSNRRTSNYDLLVNRNNNGPRKDSIKLTDIKLPAKAIAILPRWQVYDPSQLKFEVDDIVTVSKISATGQWEGEVNGRFGSFPFTYVKLILDEDNS